MRYISIDPATKSIAVAILDVNSKSLADISVVHTTTANLCGAKSNDGVDDIDRCKMITNFMKDIYSEWLIPDHTTTLIERQISGTPTYICYISIINSALHHQANPTTIQPALKNKLTIGELKLSDFYKKTLNSYTANKEHSKAIFRYIRPKLTNPNNIKFQAKHERDLADCFTQLIAHLGLVDEN